MESRLFLVLFLGFIDQFCCTSALLSGTNICIRQEKFFVTVSVSYLQPYKVRTFTTCLAFPPWCSRYTVHNKVAFKTESLEKTRVLEDCCSGYARAVDNSSCVPICGQQCLHGTCVGPNNCKCEPGYAGPTCNIACPEYKWGPNCSNSCPCLNGAKCDPVNGSCTCTPGWNGLHCDHPYCPKNYYGLHYITEYQEDGVITAIASLISEGKLESAYLLYSKRIDEKETPIEINCRTKMIEKIVSNAYRQGAHKTILDFITLQLNEPGQICQWLKALFEIMERRSYSASIDGLHFRRITKRIAISHHVLNANNNRDEICNLKQLVNDISNGEIEYTEKRIIEMAQSIQQGNLNNIVREATKSPITFDSIVRQVISKAVLLEQFFENDSTTFIERLRNTIDFINLIPLWETTIDALATLNQTMHNIEPHFIPMSQRIMLADCVKKMISNSMNETFPLQYQKKLTELKNSILLNIKNIVWDPHVFIYKYGETKQFMTTNKSKRFNSTKGFTRFEESDTTEERNQWILEPINYVDQFRIKNRESGEYLYADDNISLDGFPNKRSVFIYKVEEGSDIESLGSRAIWVVTPAYETRSERFIITNLHWKEYLDGHGNPLNEVHTWRDKVKPPLTTNHWVISDERDVERHQTRLVCYFDSSAAQREGAGRFTVDNIDPSLCTHMIYSKARIDNDTFAMTIGDEKVDIVNKGYEKIVALKQQNPQLKVMIALGGWGVDETYERLTSDPKNIETFVKSAVDFLQSYKFDGIHFDLQFLFSSDYKEGSTSLLITLNEGLRSKNYLLSATVSPLGYAIDTGYEFPQLNEILDFVSVMTFKYYGNWLITVNHHAPLQQMKSNRGGLNVKYAVKSLISEGVLPNKIVVGIPFFGTTWALESNETTPMAYGSRSAAPGKILKWEGEMAYYEICEVVQNDGWQVFQDSDHNMGPYAVSPIEPNKIRTWVGYDDPAMAAVKANYILSNGLGGAYVWDVSMDDFLNTCGGGINPMLTATANTLEIKISDSTEVSAN